MIRTARAASEVTPSVLMPTWCEGWKCNEQQPFSQQAERHGQEAAPPALTVFVQGRASR